MSGIQTGKTTRQIIYAQYGAVFIWFECNTKYPRQLATKLCREDLIIKGRDWLSCSLIDRLVHERRQIVLDHNIVVGPTEKAALIRIGEKADIMLYDDLPEKQKASA